MRQASTYEWRFIDNMIWLRKQKKITQGGLATILAVTTSRVGAWEEMRAFPSIEYLMMICKFFKVDLTKMLTVKLHMEE